MYFKFVLVPLTLAYFFTFLVAPLQNTFEFRPLILPGGRQICINTETDPDYEGDRRYKSQYRRAVMGTPTGGCYDVITTCKLPHGLSVVTTIIICATLLGTLVIIIASEIGALLADELFISSIEEAVDGAYEALNTSGVR